MYRFVAGCPDRRPLVGAGVDDYGELMDTMKAMLLEQPGSPLERCQVERPSPGAGQVSIRVEACGVCRTDLHILDGELSEIPYPVVPGHQIVGRVLRSPIETLRPGQRVGVPWLGSTCGHCGFCERGEENLCDKALFTGFHRPGGFAEYTLADARYCFPLPGEAPAEQLAPLLCAGLIGYRCLRMCGKGVDRLGLFGFGGAAHLIAPVAVSLGMEVHAFTRPGDTEGQQFARDLGCTRAGGSDQITESSLDAAIIFAPVGSLVPAALEAVRKGGKVICGGIHMSEIPAFPYSILWGERQLRSVANLTRQDGIEFLQLANELGLNPQVICYPLEQANQALEDLRQGRVKGSAVLVP